jgi:hypothetical protein
VKPGHPPDHIPAAALFRLMLETPGPTLPLQLRLPGFGPLHVRAISSRRIAQAVDYGRTLPKGLEESGASAAVIAASLYHEGGRVFASADDVLDLNAGTFDAIWREASDVLETIAPTYGRCDANAWHVKLCVGAKDPSNVAACRGLGGAYEFVAVGKHARFIDRPDRFFGLPGAELLDGHWMAFGAARAIVEEQHK